MKNVEIPCCPVHFTLWWFITEARCRCPVGDRCEAGDWMGLSSAELELADSQAESWGPGYQLNVMFLCMHNSCRSQMADGWMRKLRESDSRVGVASAGIKDGTMVKEGAIRVMAEVGVDLSSFSSNSLTEFSPERFDVVVSCCACGDHLSGPLQAWKQRKLFLDWSLDGPEKLDPGDYSVYRRVREETREKCAELLALLEEELQS